MERNFTNKLKMEEQRDKEEAPHYYSFIQRATLHARFTEINVLVAPVKSQVAEGRGVDETEQREEEAPHYYPFIQTAILDNQLTELKAVVSEESGTHETQQGQAPLGSDPAAAQQQHGGVGPGSRSLHILGFCKPTDSWVDKTKEKAPNSDSATQRTDHVSHLGCHFPELKSQLALIRYPELPMSPGIHRHNDEVVENQQQQEEEEEEVPLGSHPAAALSDLSSPRSSITSFGGPPSPVGPLLSPPQSTITSESIPTPPPSPNSDAPAGPEPFILGSILNIPLDDVPPGDSPRMDPNDENDPQNPQPQKENSVCCCFTFPRRGV